MLVLIIDSREPRALHLMHLFYDYVGAIDGKGDVYYMENSDSALKHFNGKELKVVGEQQIIQFHIILRHGNQRSDLKGANISIVYGGFGVDESRDLKAGELICSICIGNETNARKYFTPEVVKKIVEYSCNNNNVIPDFLITQQERASIEAELKNKYIEWGKANDMQNEFYESSLENIFVLLSDAIFEYRSDLADAKLKFILNKVKPLLNKWIPDKNPNYHSFSNEENLLNQIKHDLDSKLVTPIAIFITAELDLGGNNRLSVFSGIDAAQKLREIGYKGLIFIGTVMDEKDWLIKIETNWMNKFSFLESYYTYTVFIDPKNPDKAHMSSTDLEEITKVADKISREKKANIDKTDKLEKLFEELLLDLNREQIPDKRNQIKYKIEKNKKEIIQLEKKAASVYCMSDQMYDRLQKYYLDAEGKVRNILHNCNQVVFNKASVSDCFQDLFHKIDWSVLPEHESEWEKLKEQILNEAGKREEGTISDVLQDYKDNIIGLCTVKLEESVFPKKTINVLWVDDNIFEIQNYIDYFKKYASDINVVTAVSVEVAIKILEPDKKDKHEKDNSDDAVDRAITENDSKKSKKDKLDDGFDVVITDWVFLRKGGHRLAFMQGEDLVMYLRTHGISAEQIVMSNRPNTSMLDLSKLEQFNVLRLNKNFEKNELIRQIRQRAGASIRNLFEKGNPYYDSWHYSTSKNRLLYANWIYYYYYRRSIDYIAYENVINQTALMFILKFNYNVLLKTDKVYLSLNQDSVQPGINEKYIAVLNKLLDSNPESDIYSFKNKLLARRTLLGLIKQGKITDNIDLENFLMQNDDEDGNKNQTYLSEALNRYLFLGYDYENIRMNIRDLNRNLLPEEIKFLNSLEQTDNSD